MQKIGFKKFRWVMAALIIILISVFAYYYSLTKDIPDILSQLNSNKTVSNTPMFSDMPSQAAFKSPSDRYKTALSAENKINMLRRASSRNLRIERVLSMRELNAFMQQLIVSNPEIRNQLTSKGLINPVIKIADDGFIVDGTLANADNQIPIEVGLGIVSLDGYLAAQVRSVKIRGKRLPGFVVNDIAKRFSSGQENIRIALPAAIGSVKVENGQVKITSRMK